MRRDVTKPTRPTPKQASEAKDAASRLKHQLMKDALARVLGKGQDGETTAPGTPRIVLALANHGRSGWERALGLQRDCSRRRAAAWK